MTIMDRLARKGVVERRKPAAPMSIARGSAAEDARAQALGQVIENFFGGSKEALLAQLGNANDCSAAPRLVRPRLPLRKAKCAPDAAPLPPVTRFD